MALKDWRKTGKTIWEKGNSIIQISKTDFPKGYTLTIAKDVKSFNEFNKVLERTFKLKSQALSYAKNYMRTH